VKNREGFIAEKSPLARPEGESKGFPIKLFHEGHEAQPRAKTLAHFPGKSQDGAWICF
jgi:hypothetical protein